jgi:rhodanese-related sulfurtransferase
MSAWASAHYVQEVPGADGLAGRIERVPPAVLVDGRPTEDYEAGHLPGARSAAPDDIVADPAGSLPEVDAATDEVVLYGAGGRDATLFGAALALEEGGFLRVCLYVGGYAEWRASGGKTEKTE